MRREGDREGGPLADLPPAAFAKTDKLPALPDGGQAGGRMDDGRRADATDPSGVREAHLKRGKKEEERNRVS